MKKFLSMILSILLLFSVCGCSFSFKDHPLPDYSFTYGGFKCCYVTKATSNQAVKKEYATGVNVFGLIGEAKEKETIVIPESINGLPVIAIGMEGLGWSESLKVNGAQ